VQLEFVITQHVRDEQLMKNQIELLNCGILYRYGGTIRLKVTKFDDLENKIIPFFSKYLIIGVKKKDFEDFCRIVTLMKNKAHLTKEGLNKIREIKAGMNKEIKSYN
jgi:hypothetical protein